jgi:HSP20 family protein
MATMLKWSPFHELDSMERQLRRAFEGIGFAPVLPPAADVYETTDEFVVELEVPGYEERELGIQVSDHTVTVKGERKEAREAKEQYFHLHERLEREFERRFELPADADTKHLRATFAKGVLEVHAPKLAVSVPQKVEIRKA